ncbi:hypothetical protein F4780DRAFT_228258 [Xylariomycetidae sp. FL0641]|nr:hypothetical protein F4780DRAFT_228258 [Xylariomycetidae sp. FL0641]
MSEMEPSSSQPGSPGAVTPLQSMSPERANQQRDYFFASFRSPGGHRDSDSAIQDKIRQYNNMGGANAALMAKQLERKSADAALQRAMMGREAAEAEALRFREEARGLRRQIEDGRERERKVGERLETVMEQYGRAKETFSHTQALWEKEIRRARKDNYKIQSTIAKLSEELKVTTAASKSFEEALQREKERSKSREQEAFETRYQLAEIQGELQKALERVKFAEEERDAFKAAAKSEEVARIAAEGRLPLPPEEPDTEFASPKKPRQSLSAVDIMSSASSELEIEELTRLWQWEKQRADRTQEHLEFVQAECQLHCCAYAKSRSRRSLKSSSRRSGPVTILDPSDLMILGKESQLRKGPTPPPETTQKGQEHAGEARSTAAPPTEEPTVMEAPIKPKGSRRSTVFVPAEGIFRTLSQNELEAMEKVEEPPVEAEAAAEQVLDIAHYSRTMSEETHLQPAAPIASQHGPAHYSRTPSAEPPNFAPTKKRTSLLSLLNAPRKSDSHSVVSIPSMAAQDVEHGLTTDDAAVEPEAEPEPCSQAEITAIHTGPQRSHTDSAFDEAPFPNDEDAIANDDDAVYRPQTAAGHYTTTTTTTKVPLRSPSKRPPSLATVVGVMPPTSDQHHYYNDVNGSRTPSFDRSDPAFNPTMTREQALAQIRERRGRSRARSQAGDAKPNPNTPRKQMITGVKRAGAQSTGARGIENRKPSDSRGRMPTREGSVPPRRPGPASRVRS